MLKYSAKEIEAKKLFSSSIQREEGVCFVDMICMKQFALA